METVGGVQSAWGRGPEEGRQREEPKLYFVKSQGVDFNLHAPRHLRFLSKRQVPGTHSKNSYPHGNYWLGSEARDLLRSETCSEPA